MKSHGQSHGPTLKIKTADGHLPQTRPRPVPRPTAHYGRRPGRGQSCGQRPVAAAISSSTIFNRKIAFKMMILRSAYLVSISSEWRCAAVWFFWVKSCSKLFKMRLLKPNFSYLQVAADQNCAARENCQLTLLVGLPKSFLLASPWQFCSRIAYLAPNFWNCR